MQIRYRAKLTPLKMQEFEVNSPEHMEDLPVLPMLEEVKKDYAEKS